MSCHVDIVPVSFNISFDILYFKSLDVFLEVCACFMARDAKAKSWKKRKHAKMQARASLKKCKSSVDECANRVTVGGNNEHRTFDVENPIKTVLIEFWKLRRVSSKDKANMAIDMECVNVPIPGMSSMVVAVPKAVLTKDVHKGDELVLHINATPKKENEKRALPTPRPKSASQMKRKVNFAFELSLLFHF